MGHHTNECDTFKAQRYEDRGVSDRTNMNGAIAVKIKAAKLIVVHCRMVMKSIDLRPLIQTIKGPRGLRSFSQG
jgi:hypothetical protein